MNACMQEVGIFSYPDPQRPYQKAQEHYGVYLGACDCLDLIDQIRDGKAEFICQGPMGGQSIYWVTYELPRPLKMVAVYNCAYKTIVNFLPSAPFDVIEKCIKLFVDDMRKCPSGWTPATDYEDAIGILSSGAVEEVSLDHDLGTKKTGYDVACWMEKMILGKTISPMRMNCHSANPPGRKRINLVFDNIRKYLEFDNIEKYSDI